jgi:hypothetical protein
MMKRQRLRAIACIVPVSIVVLSCGGRIEPQLESHAGLTAVLLDAGQVDASYADANGGRGPAPIPRCHGELSMCVPDPSKPGVQWKGVAIVNCAGVAYMGPLDLVLEREIGSVWHTAMEQSLDEPGFGFVFQDANAPNAILDYRVCVVDELGKRCGDPFETTSPPDCGCIPYTCAQLAACGPGIKNGCGALMDCGACTNGVECDPRSRSCCPPGKDSDGWGECVSFANDHPP